jgi:hypothetical protein
MDSLIPGEAHIILTFLTFPLSNDSVPCEREAFNVTFGFHGDCNCLNFYVNHNASFPAIAFFLCSFGLLLSRKFFTDTKNVVVLSLGN